MHLSRIFKRFNHKSLIFLAFLISFLLPTQTEAVETTTEKYHGPWVDCPPSLEISKILKDPFVRRILPRAMKVFSRPDKTTQIKLKGRDKKLPLNFFHIPSRSDYNLKDPKVRGRLRIKLRNHYNQKYGSQGGKTPEALNYIVKPGYIPGINLGEQFLLRKRAINPEKSEVGAREISGYILHERKKVDNKFKYRTLVYIFVPKKDFWNEVEAQTSGSLPDPWEISTGKNRRVAASFHTHPYRSAQEEKKRSSYTSRQLVQESQGTDDVIYLDKKSRNTMIEVMKKSSSNQFKDPSEPWKPSSGDKAFKDYNQQNKYSVPGIIVGLKKGTSLYPYGVSKNSQPSWKNKEAHIDPNRDCIKAGRPVQLKACGAHPPVTWKIKKGPGKIIKQFPQDGDHLINPVAFYKAPPKSAGKTVTIEARGSGQFKNKATRTYLLSHFEITPRVDLVYPQAKKKFYVKEVKSPVKWTVTGKAEILNKKSQGDSNSPPYVKVKAPKKGSFTIRAKLEKKNPKGKKVCNKDKLKVQVGKWIWRVSGPHHIERHLGEKGKAVDVMSGVSNVLKWIKSMKKKKAQKAEKKLDRLKDTKMWVIDLGSQRAYGEGMPRGVLRRIAMSRASGHLPMAKLRKQFRETEPGNALILHASQKLGGTDASIFIGRLRCKNLAMFNNEDGWKFKIKFTKVTKDQVRGTFSGWGFCNEHLGRHMERLQKREKRAEENENYQLAEKIDRHQERDRKGNPRCGEVGLRLSGKFIVKNLTPQGDSPLSSMMPDNVKDMEDMKKMAEKMKEKFGQPGPDGTSGNRDSSSKNGSTGQPGSSSTPSSSPKKEDSKSSSQPGSQTKQNRGQQSSPSSSGKKSTPGQIKVEVVKKDLSHPLLLAGHQGGVIYSITRLRAKKSELKKLTPKGKTTTIFTPSKPTVLGALISDGKALYIGQKTAILKIVPGGSAQKAYTFPGRIIFTMHKSGDNLYVAGPLSLYCLEKGGKATKIYGRQTFIQERIGKVVFIFSRKSSVFFYTIDGKEYKILKEGIEKTGNLGLEVVDGTSANGHHYLLTEDEEIWQIDPDGTNKVLVTDQLEEGHKIAWSKGYIYVLDRQNKRIVRVRVK